MVARVEAARRRQLPRFVGRDGLYANGQMGGGKCGGIAVRRTRGCRSCGMLKDIVEVRPLGDHRLYLRFEDGVAGDVHFGRRLRFEGVFAPLREPETFARVQIHPELGTLVWPTGADVDPDVLHAELSGRPLELRQIGTRGPRWM